MRRVLAVMVVVGCHPYRAPPAPAAPPCLPTLESRITQLKDIAEPVPEGVSDREALDAMAEVLAAAGLAVEALDRDAGTLATRSFDGETLEWTCDLREHREYAYRISVVDRRWVVRLACHRAYGWDAHMSGDKVVPAERGVLTECLDSARYATRLDALRGKTAVDAARKLLAERGAPTGDPDPTH